MQAPPSNRIIASLALMAALQACVPEEAQRPPDSDVSPSFVVQQCSPPTVDGTTRPWGCAETVLLLYEGGVAAESTAIENAVTRWNAAFAAERAGAVPSFRRISRPVSPTDTGGQRRTVRVIFNGSGGSWCDATNVTGTSKAINLYPSGAQCDGNTGSTNAILLHALGHALGLSPTPMHRQGVVGVSNHCAIFLPAVGEPNAGGVNNQLCQHEIDVVLMIYGAYPADSLDRSMFWGKHILSRLGLPDTLRPYADEIRVLNPIAPYFAYAQNPPAVGNLSLGWNAQPPGLARVEAGNVLVPTKPGFVRLYAMVQENGLPSNVRRSVRLRVDSAGHQIDVNIMPLVWRPGYRVSNISGPVAPLNGGQTYGFTATVVNGGDPASLRVTWRMTRSDRPSDLAILWVTNGPHLDYFVPEGSYSLRVEATPKDLVSGKTGGAMVVDYPVCTGQVSFSGGASTNAPQGCGEPPIY